MDASSADEAIERIGAELRAMLAGYCQDRRLLRLHTPLGPDVLLAQRFDGIERLSGLPAALAKAGPAAGFRYAIIALSTDAFLDPDNLLGQPVLLELLGADSHERPRAFHGHVTGFEQLGANGGFARWRLTVEPWLAFLAQRRDSYVFQDRSVIEIIDEVFGDYVGAGLLAPAWCWQLADASIYPRRSRCTQYRETDLAFVLRLLAEEGLHGRFEASADTGSPALDSHCFVIADASRGCAADLGPVRFHRSDATEAEDSLQRLEAVAAVGTQSVALGSWDPATLDVRAVEQAGGSALPDDGRLPALVQRDMPGVARYLDRRDGERLALAQARAHAVERALLHAAGSLRRLTAGSRFTVSGHPRFERPALMPELGPVNALATGLHAERCSHVALEVRHHARNNLPVEFSRGLDRLLGPIDPASAPTGVDDAPLYANTALLLPAELPYAPAGVLRRRPAVHGLQTAIVTGTEGAALTTDRDHRVRIQFHWQRGARAQSRLEHPGASDNAPGTAASGCWVRVATAVAGNNWGSVFVPRVGAEVLVEFIEGDIDRPVVIGSVYNGRGADDAAGNRVAAGAAAATANAPAWFAGNGHPGALSGIRTQALGTSRTGQGGYNQLLFDSTPGEARLELSTTQARTWLQLGHQRIDAGNARGATLGYGNGLASDAYGAIRAAEGLLLSAHGRPGGTHAAHQAFDAAEAIRQLGEAEALARALADAAQRQNAVVTNPRRPSAQASTVGAPATGSASGLAAIAALQRSQSALAGSGAAAPTGQAWAEPMITTSAPDGIVALTPDASLWNAGRHLTVTAGHAIETLAQGRHTVAAREGIVLYTQGREPPARSTEPLRGIQFHAAQGPVRLQAQDSHASLAASREVRIASTTASVSMQARAQVLLTAQCAAIRLRDGDIEVHAPGHVRLRAMTKVLAGPQAVEAPQRLLPKRNERSDTDSPDAPRDYPYSL